MHAVQYEEAVYGRGWSCSWKDSETVSITLNSKNFVVPKYFV